MANLRFDRIWASNQNWPYPTDRQVARGLSFLGTEEPTFGLHDAIFKELDLKDKWLYDQVRNACERFGQNIDDSLADGARDTMANAITNALLTQRKADEGGYGIVKMANYETVFEGKEYNQAVSPVHLSEYVAKQNTWQNTRDKPQTATRWPTFDEVTNKPNFGDAAFYGITKHSQVSNAWSLAYDDANLATIAQCASVRDAVNNKVSEVNNSLSKIAKTGVITDASGNFPWSRVSDKPAVLNNIYNGSGDTVVTSASGSGKLTVNDEWVNFYPKGKGSCFSIGPDGRIYDASIHHDQVLGLHKVSVSGNYGDLNDKPVLADSTNKPMRYGADVSSYTDLKYEDDRIPSVSIVAQLRDGLLGVINKIRDSLSKVATSGDYNDLTNKPYLGDAANKLVSYGDGFGGIFRWSDDSLTTESYVSACFKSMVNAGAIGSYMLCMNITQSECKPGWVVDGTDLRPASASGVAGGLGGLSGRWYCCGYIPAGGASSTRITTYLRFE